MYFPIGWPKYLKVNYNDQSLLVHVASSCDKKYNAVLSERTLGIWFCKPHVEITSLKRSLSCTQQLGKNLFCLWEHDSNHIAVATSNGHIIFFKVENSKTSNTCFEQRFNSAIHDDNLSDFLPIPALTISQSHYVQIVGGVTSMAILEDGLMISSGRGLLQRVCWSDGGIKSNSTIELASLPFSADLQHSRSTQLNNAHVYVSQLDFSPQMGGFAVVLSDGRGAFLAANSMKFEPHQVVGVWAQEMNSATCVCINHKFALIAFGDSSGQGLVYYLDGATGSLVISHKLIISCKDFPDAGQVCGSVQAMKYTSDGSALAMSWKKGGFAIWSVFGSLLLQSIEIQFGPMQQGSRNIFRRFVSFEWGCEGYHLWMVENGDREDLQTNCVNDGEHDESNPASSSSSSSPSSSLLILNFVKSSLSSNPCLGNQVHLMLQGEDRLYLNPEDGLGESSISTHQSPSAIVGNRQWHIMNLPPSYLVNNWPIRYSAISSSGHWIAVAGRRGFVHYNLSSRKWKMFGNETQERDMVVTGGLTWFRDYVCVACYNFVDKKNEIRLYPRDCKLDNAFSTVVNTSCPIVLLNIFCDLVIVLLSDCVICIYNVVTRTSNNRTEVSMTKVQGINISNFILHPSNVVAITLTSLQTDSGSSKKVRDTKDAESILINVAGRLLLFQGEQTSDGSSHKNKITFMAPVIVASSVENVWLSWRSDQQKPHLTNALWLGCGSAGIKVWLPLHLRGEEQGKSKGFLSKRIMLPFTADIYPLAMLFEAGIILGANSEAVTHSSVSNQSKFPFLQLERTSQVYLHHILRQLLRRNLGVHALEIAHSCTSLVYFPHVLELLIHEVLEEEATSKEPIPDALLPRVVAFVEEFPEYLQTIAHCARKSDVAVWEYFFSVVGSPVELFKECLTLRKLDTAASYLIILQTLEKPRQAHQHRIDLLDAALEDCSWDLARDLIRYFSVIDLEEENQESSALKRIRQNSQTVYPGFYTPPSNNNPESMGDPFRHAGVVRVRSLSKEEQSIRDPPNKSKPKSDLLPNKSRHMSGVTKDVDSNERMNIDAVLDRHAKKLLKSYKLCDLAKFAANLDDYQLVGWLKKERLTSAHVEDFVSAMKAVHSDFKWPYPMLPLCNLTRLSSTNCLLVDAEQKSSQSGSPHLTSERSSLASCTNKESMDRSEIGSSGACEQDSADSWNDGSKVTATSDELEQLCLDLAAMKTGSPQANLQLRFLFQLLMEAGCLEWSLLVSLVLQDTTLFSRVVSSAYLPGTPEESIKRLSKGIQEFQKWSETECYGYKTLLDSLREDILLLESLEKESASLAPSTKKLASIARCNSLDNPQASTNKETELTPNVTTKTKEHKITGDATGEENATENNDRMCILS